ADQLLSRDRARPGARRSREQRRPGARDPRPRQAAAGPLLLARLLALARHGSDRGRDRAAPARPAPRGDLGRRLPPAPRLVAQPGLALSHRLADDAGRHRERAKSLGPRRSDARGALRAPRLPASRRLSSARPAREPPLRPARRQAHGLPRRPEPLRPAEPLRLRPRDRSGGGHRRPPRRELAGHLPVARSDLDLVTSSAARQRAVAYGARRITSVPPETSPERPAPGRTTKGARSGRRVPRPPWRTIRRADSARAGSAKRMRQPVSRAVQSRKSARLRPSRSKLPADSSTQSHAGPKLESWRRSALPSGWRANSWPAGASRLTP